MNDICGVYNTHKNIKGELHHVEKGMILICFINRGKKKCEMVKLEEIKGMMLFKGTEIYHENNHEI